MGQKERFKQAKQKLMTQVERGDIITYQPPGSDSWERGVVYNLIAHPRTKEIIGHILLPLETIGIGKKMDEHSKPLAERSHSPHWLVKDNGTITELAGGKADVTKTVFYFNFVKAYNAEVYERQPGNQRDFRPKPYVWVMGSYTLSNVHEELLNHVKSHYLNNEMFSEGKIIPAGTPVNIMDPDHARKKRQQSRDNRQDVLEDLASSNRRTGTSSFEDITRHQPAKPIRKAPPKSPAQENKKVAPVAKPPGETAAPIPPVAKHFEAARKYDVPLKELFVLVNAGGERMGITRLLGGLPDDIQENDGIQSMVDPSKDRTEITLRDAIKFIESKGSVSDLAKALQTAGSISEVSAQKAATRLVEVRDALDKVQVVDGKPTSDNPIVDRLISDNKLIVTEP